MVRLKKVFQYISDRLTAGKRVMGLWSATSIGVGAMIGAGIFALVGIAIELAGPYAYISFSLAGLIAILTSYSVSKLAIYYPSKAGRIKYLIEGFGNNILSGGINIMMWLGYIIVTSLYARAFSNYALAFFGLDENFIWLHVFTSGIIILFLVINFIGANLVGKSELIIVAIKVSILLIFSILGFFYIDPHNLIPDHEDSFANLFVVSGIVFLSYEGFGLVANTAEDIKKPQKNIPRALYISIGLVALVYISVTLVVLGSLPMNKIIQTKEYVLAEAAKPFFGEAGFKIMAIAALFSTASAINATIYGPVYMVYETAQADQLPGYFERKIFREPTGTSLLITGILILFFANFFNIEEIAKLGSLAFLINYISVNAAHLFITDKTEAKRWIIWLAIFGCVFVLGMLIYYEFKTSKLTLIILLIMIAFSFMFEWIYKRMI